MLNIVLFGPPGAGKGTQATLLKEKLNLIHLSTGELLRNHMAQHTELGDLAKVYIDKGELVPDELVIGMIKSDMKCCGNKKGIIFDGFPRTVAQAAALDELMNDLGMPVSGMIALEVPHDELIDRLLQRGATSGRTDDQRNDVIENRISIYHSLTSPVMEYYKKQNKYYPVIGIGDIDEINERLLAVINKL
ncbi:MAG: adenylate kinase [Prolixibacteraceae bacterium]|nr:adenylate kinase [Prolixibacteraceae bacterium]